jgi:hypothetical protein
MGKISLQFREHPICTVSAGALAVLYWIAVWWAYRGAEANNTGLGYEWVPFMILSEPWSGFLSCVAPMISNYHTTYETYIVSCIWLCGINACILFLVIYLMLSHLFDQWLGA